MFIAVNLRDPEHGRDVWDADSFQGVITRCVDYPETQPWHPQAFLVEQAAGFLLRTHFHEVHQFQVVVEGGGTLGKHALPVWSVHYSTPQSGYGPLVAGPEGIGYLTLRATTNWAAGFIPEDRSRMQKGLTKSQFTLACDAEEFDTEHRDSACVVTKDLLASGSEQAAVSLIRLPCHTRLALEPAVAGRYYILVSGGLILATSCLAEKAIVFLSAGDAATIQADDAGATLLALQFPPSASLSPPCNSGA